MAAVDRWQVVSGGRVLLDGGAMFGVVPKPLWEKPEPADGRNRITCDTNCLLIYAGGRVVLVDTGYGGKAPAKVREVYGLEDGQPLLRSLAAAGVRPEDVTDVILTHLHFDHAGGATTFDETGRVVPTFPNATYTVQRREFLDATSGAPELAGAYFAKDFRPLADAGRLLLLDGPGEHIPGVRVEVVGGHTAGLQMVVLDAPEGRVYFPGDLCPLSAHLRPNWNMGYDNHPLEVRRQRVAVLGRIVDEGAVMVFGHDSRLRAARLARDAAGRFVVKEEAARGQAV